MQERRPLDSYYAAWGDGLTNESGSQVDTHPWMAGLSCADLTQLAKPGIERVVAVAADGTVYEASAEPRYDAETFQSLIYPAVAAGVRERLVFEAWRTWVPEEVLSRLTSHLTSLVLQRMRMIDYRITPSVNVRVELERHHDLFDRIVTAGRPAAEKPRRHP